MSLQQWLENSWIRRVDTSTQEIAGLLQIAERETADARLPGISCDGRFEHAYNAVRSLAQLALHASGHVVPKGVRQHERTIESLKFTLGQDWSDEADYFDQCRRSRNKSLYDRAGMIQQRDADELLARAENLEPAVRAWLRDNHPDALDAPG